MPQHSYYVITLPSKIRFVAYMSDAEAEIPGMLRLRAAFVERDILLPQTAIEAMAPCTEEEARMSAKTLNGKSMFLRYFGEVPIRLKW